MGLFSGYCFVLAYAIESLSPATSDHRSSLTSDNSSVFGCTPRGREWRDVIKAQLIESVFAGGGDNRLGECDPSSSQTRPQSH